MEINQIYQEDCVQGLSQLQDNSVDLFVCDPPYNASKSKPMEWKEKSYKKIDADWDKIDDLDGFNERWIKAVEPKLKEGGAIYVTCSFHNISSLMNAFAKTGLTFRNIVTWFKPDAMPMQVANQGFFAYSCEYVLFYSKGSISKRWNYRWMCNRQFPLKATGSQQRDLLVMNVSGDEKTGHPSQKPEKLIKYLIQTCTQENDLVVDCFMGSGTTAVSCLKLGRLFVGFELNPEYVQQANERIRGWLSQKSLGDYE